MPQRADGPEQTVVLVDEELEEGPVDASDVSSKCAWDGSTCMKTGLDKKFL